MTPELRQEFAREFEHWENASERLSDLDMVAPPQAWLALEHYLGIALRQSLTTVLARLRAMARAAKHSLTAPDADVSRLQGRLADLRQAYLRAETTVDFFADALLTRTIPRAATFLRACDHIATRSMAEALAPLGREVPKALTYIDKGLGASVIKSGLRLWDGTVDCPVATIKVTRHHMFRACQLLHESGHQVAFTLGWNAEFADALRRSLGSRELGQVWASWASELSADAFAHVHTGYAATAALHDVVDGAQPAVFQFFPGDPHPVAYVRVLCAIEMCRHTFGAGPWDQLASAWTAKHPLDACPSDIRSLMRASVKELPRIAHVALSAPYQAFRGQALTRLINPARVSPAALAELARTAGDQMTSPYWAFNEAIRLLAWSGYQAALGPRELRDGMARQEAWMLRLGALTNAA